MLGSDRQPCVCAARGRHARAPRNRRARTVAAECQRPVRDRFGILELLERHVRLRQAELLTLVDEDVAAQTAEQQHRHARHRGAIRRARPTRRCARRIVIGERPARPARAGAVGPCRDGLLDQLRRQPIGLQEIEAVRAVKALRAGGEALHVRLRVRAADLGHGEAVAIAVDQLANALDEQRNVGMRLVVQRQLEIAGPRAQPAIGRRRRIVAQLRIVHGVVHRIEAEAVDAAVEPEARAFQQLVLHARGCARSGPAARRGSCAGSTARGARPRSRPDRRTRTASCSAASRPGRASAHTYQSARGLSRLARLSRNHSC